MAMNSQSIKRAVLAGLIATGVLIAFMYLAPLAGLPRIDMASSIAGFGDRPAELFSIAGGRSRRLHRDRWILLPGDLPGYRRGYSAQNGSVGWSGVCCCGHSAACAYGLLRLRLSGAVHSISASDSARDVCGTPCVRSGFGIGCTARATGDAAARVTARRGLEATINESRPRA